MNFTLDAEQALFKDAIDRFIACQYGFEQRRQYQSEPGGWSRSIWAQLAEQGFLSLPFDTAHDGLGYGPIETMIVMEALGRGLVLEPYLTTVVHAGAILRGAATSQQLEIQVPNICSGQSVIAVATTERQSRYVLNDVATCAELDGEYYVLSGNKIIVFHGGNADQFIVSARTSGERCDSTGISLFLVDENTPGIKKRVYRTQDGLQAADLMLTQLRIPVSRRLGAEGAGLAALQRAREFAIAALAAESVGAMQALLDMTVDHLQQRQQFGAPIGRFQALQHRAAEMLVELEQARSMAIYAALMVDDADIEKRGLAISAVKYQIGKSGRTVGQLAVQLHGGIGVSEECPVGHYFRRLTMMDALFGDGDFHLSRVAVT